MAKKIVKFYRGTENNYKQAILQNPDKYKDGVFFATDNNTIWMDGACYGKPYNDELVWEKLNSAFVAIDTPTNWSQEGKYEFTFVSVDGSAEYSIAVLPATETRAGTMSASDFIKLGKIKEDEIVYQKPDYDLSQNDFTDELKNKLDSIEEGAHRNIINVVKVDGEALIPDTTKAVNIPISDIIKEQITTGVTTAYIYKGSVATTNELPTTGMLVGDVWNIIEESIYGAAGVNVAWNGNEWDTLGGVFSTEELEKEIDNRFNDIEDRLDEIEGYNPDNRLKNLEDTVNILIDTDETLERTINNKTVKSIANTAVTIAVREIEEALTWEEI